MFPAILQPACMHADAQPNHCSSQDDMIEKVTVGECMCATLRQLHLIGSEPKLGLAPEVGYRLSHVSDFSRPDVR